MENFRREYYFSLATVIVCCAGIYTYFLQDFWPLLGDQYGILAEVYRRHVFLRLEGWGSFFHTLFLDRWDKGDTTSLFPEIALALGLKGTPLAQVWVMPMVLLQACSVFHIFSKVVRPRLAAMVGLFSVVQLDIFMLSVTYNTFGIFNAFAFCAFAVYLEIIKDKSFSFLKYILFSICVFFCITIRLAEAGLICFAALAAAGPYRKKTFLLLLLPSVLGLLWWQPLLKYTIERWGIEVGRGEEGQLEIRKEIFNNHINWVFCFLVVSLAPWMLKIPWRSLFKREDVFGFLAAGFIAAALCSTGLFQGEYFMSPILYIQLVLIKNILLSEKIYFKFPWRTAVFALTTVYCFAALSAKVMGHRSELTYYVWAGGRHLEVMGGQVFNQLKPHLLKQANPKVVILYQEMEPMYDIAEPLSRFMSLQGQQNYIPYKIVHRKAVGQKDELQLEDWQMVCENKFDYVIDVRTVPVHPDLDSLKQVEQGTYLFDVFGSMMIPQLGQLTLVGYKPHCGEEL